MNGGTAGYAALRAENTALRSALEDAQRAINSMKHDAETAAQWTDDANVGEALESISQQGLAADMALRASLAKVAA